MTARILGGAVALALPTLIATAPVPAAAQSIVVRSTGPSATALPPGKRIANGQQLALKKGDKLTILGPSGSKEFKGPGNFRVDAKTLTGSNIVAAVGNTGAKNQRTGAVRGGARWERPANYWMLEADRPGKVCFADGQRVALWLPRINIPHSVSLTRLQDNKDVPLALGAGQRIAPWPSADLPPTSGDRIRISIVGSGPGAVLEFVKLSSATAGNVDLAEAFIRAGCDSQLDVLLNAAGTPELEEIREGRALSSALP